MGLYLILMILCRLSAGKPCFSSYIAPSPLGTTDRSPGWSAQHGILGTYSKMIEPRRGGTHPRGTSVPIGADTAADIIAFITDALHKRRPASGSSFGPNLVPCAVKQFCNLQPAPWNLAPKTTKRIEFYLNLRNRGRRRPLKTPLQILPQSHLLGKKTDPFAWDSFESGAKTPKRSNFI